MSTFSSSAVHVVKISLCLLAEVVLFIGVLTFALWLTVRPIPPGALVTLETFPLASMLILYYWNIFFPFRYTVYLYWIFGEAPIQENTAKSNQNLLMGARAAPLFTLIVSIVSFWFSQTLSGRPAVEMEFFGYFAYFPMFYVPVIMIQAYFYTRFEFASRVLGDTGHGIAAKVCISSLLVGFLQLPVMLFILFATMSVNAKILHVLLSLRTRDVVSSIQPTPRLESVVSPPVSPSSENNTPPITRQNVSRGVVSSTSFDEVGGRRYLNITTRDGVVTPYIVTHNTLMYTEGNVSVFLDAFPVGTAVEVEYAQTGDAEKSIIIMRRLAGLSP